jgi:hypothetical protein
LNTGFSNAVLSKMGMVLGPKREGGNPEEF